MKRKSCQLLAHVASVETDGGTCGQVSRRFKITAEGQVHYHVGLSVLQAGYIRVQPSLASIVLSGNRRQSHRYTDLTMARVY